MVETNGYYADGRLVAHWAPAKGLTTYGHGGDQSMAGNTPLAQQAFGFDAGSRLQSVKDGNGEKNFQCF